MFRRFAWSFTFVFAAACGGSVTEAPADDTGVADTGADTAKTPDAAVDSTAADTNSADVVFDDVAVSDDTGLTSNHEGGVACGMATCVGGDVCCANGGIDAGVTLACAKTCTTGSTIACTSPDNCGQNPCCSEISAAGGGGTPGALCGAAPTDCPPKIDIASRSAQTRLCRNDADCSSGAPMSGLPTCCTITYQGNTFKGCFNKQYAPLAGQIGASITCP
jgi:hypothetical protein